MPYTVQSGDTLSAIAAANGMSLQRVVELNPQFTNPDAIYPGQQVNLEADAGYAANNRWDPGIGNLWGGRVPRTGKAMTEDQAASDLVVQKFRLHLKRDPTPQEMDYFANVGEWAVMDYIRHYNGGKDYFQHSPEAHTAITNIKNSYESIFKGRTLTDSQVIGYLQNNDDVGTLERGWRQSDLYKKLYPGIRPGMDEKDYQTEFGNLESLYDVYRNLFPGKTLKPGQLVRYLQHGWSPQHVIEQWKSSKEYKQLYRFKPTSMAEWDYRTATSKMAMEAEQTRDLWLRWKGRNLSDDELLKIYVDQSSPEHKEFTRMTGWEIGSDALRRNATPQNTLVRLGPGGPQQQLLRGMESGAGGGKSDDSFGQLN